MNPKTKKMVFRIGLLVVALSPLILLVFAEGMLRIVRSHALYFTETNPHYLDTNGLIRLRPDTDVYWYGDHYVVNSNGFRMPHEVGPKRGGGRILAIGDSVTLGMGVLKTEDVWPNYLERLLHERGYASMDVINSGVQAWDLMIYDKEKKLVPGAFTRFVGEAAPKYSPDVVVYCICLNDVPSELYDTFDADNKANKQRFRFFSESWREWFKRKAVYRLARDYYREKRFYDLDFSGQSTRPQTPEYWRQVTEELGRLKQAVEENHAKLFCIVLPFSYEVLPANKNLLRVNEGWLRALDENKIPWADLTPQFNPTNALGYYALGDYIHPNTKGHHLIAEEALKLIQPVLTNSAQVAGR